jgi:glycosyltransferase involved in cell wall biosynthesis
MLNQAREYEDTIVFLIVFDSKNSKISETNQDRFSTVTSSNFEVIIGKYDSVGSARNAGIDRVKTDWFSFCDADDTVIFENYIQLLGQISESEIDLIIGSYSVVNRGVKVPKINKIEMSENRYEFSRSPGLWRYIFRTSKVSNVRFPPINMAEDQVYLSRIFGINPKVGLSTKSIYEYSLGVSGSLTSNLSQILTIKVAIDLSSRLPKSKLEDLRCMQDLMIISQWLTYLKHSHFLVKPTLFLGFARSLISRTYKDTKMKLSFLYYCLKATK